jgi:predicted nucleic acid-binding protein
LSSVVLDTGALIAYERRVRRVVVLVQRALAAGDRIVVPAGVVAQAWRDGRRQARLAWLLADDLCEVVALDDAGARAAGQLLGLAGTADVVDASVAVVARQRELRVLTSDPDDLRRLDSSLDVVAL